MSVEPIYDKRKKILQSVGELIYFKAESF